MDQPRNNMMGAKRPSLNAIAVGMSASCDQVRPMTQLECADKILADSLDDVMRNLERLSVRLAPVLEADRAPPSGALPCDEKSDSPEATLIVQLHGKTEAVRRINSWVCNLIDRLVT